MKFRPARVPEMGPPSPPLPPALTEFVRRMDAVVARVRREPARLDLVADLMRDLVRSDGWLPPEFAKPHPQYYQQYLLHADARGRYSVVSFVWGPGQKTPVHDHCTWGVVGVLRGQELSQAWRAVAGGLVADGPQHRLCAGEVAMVSPDVGDIHEVRNAFDDRVSISIHVYGTDIGRQRRHVFDTRTGAMKEFVSGYANADRAAV